MIQYRNFPYRFAPWWARATGRAWMNIRRGQINARVKR